jgi:hypothetical protein
LLKERVAAATAAVAVAIAALDVAKADPEVVRSGLPPSVEFFRGVLVARRRLRCVEVLSADVSREVTPPVVDGDLSDDEDETVRLNEKRQRRLRLLPLAIRMVLGYQPPPNREAGELFSAHNFASAAFKRSLILVVLYLFRKFYFRRGGALRGASAESRTSMIRHISTFFGATHLFMFEKLTGEEAFVIDKLVSVRAFCASTADTEAEIPVLGGTRPSIAKRIGILTQGPNPIDAAAASKIAHKEAGPLKRKRS